MCLVALNVSQVESALHHAEHRLQQAAARQPKFGLRSPRVMHPEAPPAVRSTSLSTIAAVSSPAARISVMSPT